MQYTFFIETPKSTSASSPVKFATPLNKGRLSKVGVYFPFGCGGLVHVRILHYEHQLYPTNVGNWLSGNDILIEFECAYDIEEGWTEFKVEVYNEDNFYAHTPVVIFVVLPISGLYTEPVGWVEG